MFIVLVGSTLVVCHVCCLTCSCRWWPAGCVSGTGVGPFVVVLGARVVSVFIVLVRDVPVVTVFIA